MMGVNLMAWAIQGVGRSDYVIVGYKEIERVREREDVCILHMLLLSY